MEKKEHYWYLLQCRAQQQARAELHLRNQGFEFYSPAHQVRRLSRGRGRSLSSGNPQIQTRSEALFPGYLFIRLGEESNWRSLQATRGVNRVVSFNGSPHRVPDSLIAALRQRFDGTGVPAPLFMPGERVMITEGCFRHVEAIVKATSSDERVVVLMNILQTTQVLEFEPRALARVG